MIEIERKLRFPWEKKSKEVPKELISTAEFLVNALENGTHEQRVDAVAGVLMMLIEEINSQYSKMNRKIDQKADLTKLRDWTSDSPRNSIGTGRDPSRPPLATVYINSRVIGRYRPEEIGHLRAHGAPV